MADKWKTAFKQIHGKTPTKSDYTFAPDHIKSELLKNIPENSPKNTERKSRKRPAVQLKRPETFSPMKKRNRPDLASPAPSSAPRPLGRFPRPSSTSSPLKRVLFNLSPQKPARVLEDLTKNARFLPSQFQNSPLKSIISILSTAKSPLKVLQSPILLRSSPRKSVLKPLSTVKTPNALDELSPMKSVVSRTPRNSFFTPEKPLALLSVEKNQTTPIRSPKKPACRVIVMRNIGSLLMASAEKRKPEEREDIPNFNDETQELSEAVIHEEPKTKKTYKFNAKREAAKANGENYVRISLRKKQFVRGKMSAEAKRKMVRKQKWKAKFGGKKF